METRIREWTSAAADVRQELRRLVVEAGRKILAIYDGDFDVTFKDDRSPLTAADMAAHHHIVDSLAALDGPSGSIPILSEEGGIPDYGERRRWEAWWLVDPLDGTKEFVKRNGEFTVNVALVIRNTRGIGEPVAGWVYAPVKGILYEGILGDGSVRVDVDADGDRGFRSPRPLPIATRTAGEPPRIVSSRSHGSGPTEAVISAIIREFGDGGTVNSGSSLKFCLVAEGTADIYPRPAPTMEWDTAAADAVCRASGVRVVDVERGVPLAYGTEGLKNPWFLAGRDDTLIETARAEWSG